MSRRILAIASGGGHWVELQRLKPAFEGLDVVYASVYPEYADDVPGHRFYSFRDVSRWDRFGFFVLAFQLLRILMIERPKIVITTGSLPCCIALILAKYLLGAKTMWIDSIANVQQLSSSGKLAGKFADVWLTQWPGVGKRRRPSILGSRPMIFVTVGSMFPFERMIRMMDEWTSDIRKQRSSPRSGAESTNRDTCAGSASSRPPNIKRWFNPAAFIVAHAGTGSVFTASEFRKPIVLIPRRAAQKEHTTDHQLDTAKWLENKPGIFIVWSEQELAEAIERAEQAVGNIQSLTPPSAPEPFLARIRDFLVT